MMDIVTFALTHLSLILCVVLFFVTLNKSQRSNIQAAFYTVIFIMVVWNIGTLLDIYYRLIYGSSNMIFVALCYFGICFVPVAILFLGKAMSPSFISIKPYHALLLVIPCISMIIICTNSHHNLFFVNYSVYSNEAVYGLYYYFHSVYSYSCILVGIGYMISFSRKNSGIFSSQSLLILLGILIPLLANILYSFDLLDLTFDINVSMFAVALLCFAIAFYKYDFLKVAPIAIQNIVDLISNGYLVIDNQYNIIAHNKAMQHLLPDRKAIPQNMRLETFMEHYCDQGTYAVFLKLQGQAIAEKCTMSMEYTSRNHLCFNTEITPIFKKRILIGTIILLKDITQAKRDLETIKETQAILMERERLASLGQMIGGITHNLKTPILSISGAVEGLIDLTSEYEESIDDPSVTVDDHHEIANEMREWIDKIKVHCSYISDVITTVKGQAVQFNRTEIDAFTIDEFLKRLELLMKGELKKASCTLRTRIFADVSSQITGDISSLVQVFDNLIMNSIYAYEGKPGFIDLAIAEDTVKYTFSVTDYGKGIEPSVQARLFKEMVTTKGKNGTGLGLYLSHSTIRGHFNGQLTITSVIGEGATFTITIPKHRREG